MAYYHLLVFLRINLFGINGTRIFFHSNFKINGYLSDKTKNLWIRWTLMQIFPSIRLLLHSIHYFSSARTLLKKDHLTCKWLIQCLLLIVRLLPLKICQLRKHSLLCLTCYPSHNLNICNQSFNIFNNNSKWTQGFLIF